MKKLRVADKYLSDFLKGTFLIYYSYGLILFGIYKMITDETEQRKVTLQISLIQVLMSAPVHLFSIITLHWYSMYHISWPRIVCPGADWTKWQWVDAFFSYFVLFILSLCDPRDLNRIVQFVILLEIHVSFLKNILLQVIFKGLRCEENGKKERVTSITSAMKDYQIK